MPNSPIIQKISEEFGKYYWYGWARITGRHGTRFNYIKNDSGHYLDECVIAFKTVIGKSQIEITFRLNFLFNSWEGKVNPIFYPSQESGEEHNYFIELEITDPLKRYDRKILFKKIFKKGDKKNSYLEDLFKKIREIVHFNFPPYLVEKKSKQPQISLKEIVNLL